MPTYSGGNPLKGKRKNSTRGVSKPTKGGSARDPESIRKEIMVRKGVPNHVSA